MSRIAQVCALLFVIGLSAYGGSDGGGPDPLQPTRIDLTPWNADFEAYAGESYENPGVTFFLKGSDGATLDLTRTPDVPAVWAAASVFPGRYELVHLVLRSARRTWTYAMPRRRAST